MRPGGVLGTASTVTRTLIRQLSSERRMDPMRWGLIPFFARGTPTGAEPPFDDDPGALSQ